MSRRLFLLLSGLLGVFSFARIARAQEKGDDSKFIKDVNFPDGTKVKPGQRLVKKWEIKNAGSVTWKDRFLAPVESTAGEDDLKAIKKTKVPLTKAGQLCTLEAELVAPKEKGTYKVTFKMMDKDGKECFPDKQGVYIEVVVE